MEMRILGETGLPVSVIGLGLAALGRPGYINLRHAADLGGETDVQAMQHRTDQILDVAWAGGVRYFDVARSYGLGEKFLGDWLTSRSMPPGGVTVGSKWGYRYTAGWKTEAPIHEVKDHSLPNLRVQWAESTALLDGHLRLYQIHSATTESGVLKDRGVLNELSGLKNQGVCIGLTLSGPRQTDTLRASMEIRLDGAPLFDVVEATWNLLEPSCGPALSEAHREGMGIIIKEALANGRLTLNTMDQESAPIRTVLEQEASARNCGVDAIALAACLAQPFADVVLSGAVTEQQLRSNLRAQEVHLNTQSLDRLLATAYPPDDYWKYRRGMTWN